MRKLSRCIFQKCVNLTDICLEISNAFRYIRMFWCRNKQSTKIFVNNSQQYSLLQSFLNNICFFFDLWNFHNFCFSPIIKIHISKQWIKFRFTSIFIIYKIPTLSFLFFCPGSLAFVMFLIFFLFVFFIS
jgi:hypothetical protein